MDEHMWRYIEYCEAEGIEFSLEGYQDWLFDKADLALGDL